MPERVMENVIDACLVNFVCLDDEYVEPYSSGEVEGNIEFTKSIHDGFRDAYKNVKIIKYGPETDVEDLKRHFGNADILVLDWELDPSGGSSEPALEFLNAAIDSERLKYVFVYTHVIEAHSGTITWDHEQMRRAIVAAFSLEGEEVERGRELSGKMEELRDKLLDEDFMGDEEDWEDIVNRVTEKLYRHLAEQTELSGRGLAESLPGFDVKKQMRELCGKLSKSEKNTTEIIDFAKSRLWDTVSDSMEPFGRKLKAANLEDDEFLIGDTHVKLVSKSEFDGSKLPGIIRDFVAKKPDSFFRILSHEIMDRFNREYWGRVSGFNFIENEIVRRYVNYEGNPEDGRITLGQLVREAYGGIFVSVIEEGKFEMLEEAERFFGSLSPEIRLSDEETKRIIRFANKFLSIEPMSPFARRKSGNRISFGDIFEYDAGEHGGEKKYAICITPHCDCAHPENINHEYRFVLSRSVTKDFELANTNFDEEFCSFVPLRDASRSDIEDVSIVYWKAKDGEFVKTNVFRHVTETTEGEAGELLFEGFSGEKFHMRYICRQKDEFTQRLMNESVRHAIRVGVSFLNPKELEGEGASPSSE